jgi:DNA-directed RNA polymerase
MKRFTIEDQVKLEQEWKHYAENRLRKIINDAKLDGNASTTKIGRTVLDSLTSELYGAMESFIKEETRKKKGVQPLYKPLLLACQGVYESESEQVSADLVMVMLTTTILNVLDRSLKGDSYSSTAYSIGREILSEVNLQKYIKEHSSEVARTQLARMDKRNHLHYRAYYLQNLYKDEKWQYLDFSKKEIIALGAQLIEMTCATTGLFEVEGFKDFTKIKPTEAFLKAWKASEDDMLRRVTRYIPTIVPPKDWTSTHSGGYYSGSMRALFMRLFQNRVTKQYNKRLNEVDISPIYDAVNLIQKTPYHINTKVLEVIQTLAERGISFGDFPSTEPLPEVPNTLTPESTEDEINTYKAKVIERIYAESRRQSKALRLLMIVGMAKDFSKYPRIYIPHNIDFRGRIYPLPMLNPQGDDMTKALLAYTDPVPCESEDDLQILKSIGANFFGEDKISFDSQQAFINDMEDEIIRIATDPLATLSEWAKADEPFQYLGWCIEYKRALEYMHSNGGSIVGFRCEVVIAFDGTCSGIQHYSAMLRDEDGGRAVNLIDADVPQDIYGIVANEVRLNIEKDAKNGTLDEEGTAGGDSRKTLKLGTKSLAQMWLAHGIDRKVTKRNVMTLSYGSGQYGFSEQLYEDIVKDSPCFGAYKKQAANYMAKHVWEAVNKTLRAAPEAMKWLKKVASAYVKAGQPVQWTTPLGLPVVQLYLDFKVERFVLRVRGTNVRRNCFYSNEDETAFADRQQLQGIAPNFIHSLDATHLVMTINAAKLKHATTVHDSFGTSLGEARKLWKELRVQFHKLYSENDPLAALKDEVEFKTAQTLENAPKKGSLNLDEVLTSKYLFH